MKGKFAEELGPCAVRLLWFTLGLALLLRFWGTWYGLPHSYWVDEYHEVMRALELGAGGFNFDRTSKGGFYYLLFFEYGLFYVFLKLTGFVKNTGDFAELFVRDPSAFYLMGRMTAALIGGITVAAAFHLARSAYSANAGLLATLFLAVNLLHIDLSRRIGVDIPMTMFVTLSLYFGVRIAVEGRRRDYLLAALCAALATTTKLPGILVLPPLLVAHTYFVGKSGGGLRGWIGTRDIWIAAAIFVLVLVATNPGIVARTGYLELFTSAPDETSYEGAIAADMEYGGDARPNLFAFYLTALRESMGWPLFALGLISVGYALWKRTAPDVILVTYAFIHYLVISSTSSEILYYPRYAIPIVVILAVLTGRAVHDLNRLIPRHRIAVVSAISIACAALPFAQSIETGYALAQTDTRALAKSWFEAHVPAGRRVLIEGAKIAPDRGTVPLFDSQPSLKRRIEFWKLEEPRQARFLEIRLAAHEGGGYDLELIKFDSVLTLDDYVSMGIEYFVVRPDYFVGSRRAGTASGLLLHELRSDERVQLVQHFAGNSRTQLGPTVEIYRLLH